MLLELINSNQESIASNKLNFNKILNNKHATHWINLKHENNDFLEVCIELLFNENFVP